METPATSSGETNGSVVEITAIKDLKSVANEKNVAVKATVTAIDEAADKKSSHCTLQDGNDASDAVILVIYKEGIQLVQDRAYILRNIIKKEKYLVATTASRVSRCKLPEVEKVKLAIPQKQDNEGEITGRIVQVSPCKATSGDTIQNVRIKQQNCEIVKISLWGKTCPGKMNDLCQINRLKSYKSQLSSTKESEISFPDLPNKDDFPVVIDDDVIISGHFPQRMEGVLEAIDQVSAYTACIRCNKKKEAEKCSKCNNTAAGQQCHIVRVIVKSGDNNYTEKTIFEREIRKAIGGHQMGRNDKIEDAFFEKIGEKMLYYEERNVLSDIVWQ